MKSYFEEVHMFKLKLISMWAIFLSLEVKTKEAEFYRIFYIFRLQFMLI